MSAKQWLALLFLFVAYLLLGASVFYQIEHTLEKERRLEQREERKKIYELLQLNCGNESQMVDRDLLTKLTEYCGKSVFNHSRDEPYHWHFYNSVFFVITVVSTIGYGNLAPTCSLSRNLMILYGLVGIPMIGILLTHMADFFGHFFLRAHHKYKMHRYENRLGLIGNILLYLIPGLLVFVICPSGLFVIFEKWTFDEGVYFAFVTLTTIGFGDLVAGQDDHQDVWYILYKIFLVFWVIFGLGYLVMVLGFITRAMRSKRMARLEHKLARNIKHTQNKLWSGFCSEMGYLRRVMNELYLLKLKPVYHDDVQSLGILELGPRSASWPDLRGIRNAMAGSRPRAQSEVLPGRPLLRRRSETELYRIDRRATFADTSAPAATAALDSAELLHEFMNAIAHWGEDAPAPEPQLKNIPGSALSNGAYLGFSDADILKSEDTAGRLSVTGNAPAWPRARGRATSLAPYSPAAHSLDTFQDSTSAEDSNGEWTWSGAAASRRVHELIRARQDRRQSEAPSARQKFITDRRLQQLQDLQQRQRLEQLRQLHKERRQQQRRIDKRTRSASAAAADVETGLQRPTRSPSSGGLIQRLGIPQRIKDLVRRGSLQTTGVQTEAPKGRSPSVDPAPAPPPLVPYESQRTHSVGDTFDVEMMLPGLNYRTHSAGDAEETGILPPPRRCNSVTIHPMLENTSLADFLRALQSVHSQPPPPAQARKTRKMGTASFAPQTQMNNSIFNLFPNTNIEEKSEKRRFSLRPTLLNGNGNTAATDLPEQKPSRRRMSFWPVFGADSHSNTVQPTSRGSRSRKLSSLFSSCEDKENVNAEGVKVVKKRRFSIWPTLGASKSSEEEKQPDSTTIDSNPASLAPPAIPPQITITAPSPAPPRESLRRMALTSNLVSNNNADNASISEASTIAADDAYRSANIRQAVTPGFFSTTRASPSGRSPSLAASAHQANLWANLTTGTTYRRRANSDVSQTKPRKDDQDNHSFNERL